MKEIEKERKEIDFRSANATSFWKKHPFAALVLFVLSVFILFELGKRVGEAAFHLSN